MEPVLDAISEFIVGWPPILVPIVIALLAVAAAAWWIRNFFESRRTPAGFGKMTDDDWFRVIFVAFSVSPSPYCLRARRLRGQDSSWRGALGGCPGRRRYLEPLRLDGGQVQHRELQHGGRGCPFGRTARVSRGQRSSCGVGAEIPQYGESGMIVSIPFFAIWTGVTLYTAAFIAEIVRGGILAVPKGQTEAAMAWASSAASTCARSSFPRRSASFCRHSATSTLNLAKNTSLGLAVAYADIVAVGFTIINQTGSHYRWSSCGWRSSSS